MKRSRFAEKPIISILRQQAFTRRPRIPEAPFDQDKATFGNMEGRRQPKQPPLILGQSHAFRIRTERRISNTGCMRPKRLQNMQRKNASNFKMPDLRHR